MNTPYRSPSVPATWDADAAAWRRRTGPILKDDDLIAYVEQNRRRKPARRTTAPAPSWADRNQSKERDE